MPNHMHLIAVPQSEEGLRRAMGEAHRRYTREINFREGWRGHLWQGRFASFPMDESYLLAAARYVELNPVRAKLVHRPEAYKWSRRVEGVKSLIFRIWASLSVKPPVPRHFGEQEVERSVRGLTIKDLTPLPLHTDEGDTIRIISARVASKGERRIYEEG